MKQAVLRVYIDEPVATIDPRIYSGFIEHLGRAIYGGLHEPNHPTADRNGFRGDVADALLFALAAAPAHSKSIEAILAGIQFSTSSSLAAILPPHSVSPPR